jgi:hypothetical protein
VFNPAMVDEAKPPNPLVSSHSLERAKSSREQMPRSKRMTSEFMVTFSDSLPAASRLGRMATSG